MKTPNYEDAEKCIAIRKSCKQGAPYNEEYIQFCKMMLASYPEWYEETNERVFNETVPFGSSVRYTKPLPKGEKHERA